MVFATPRSAALNSHSTDWRYSRGYLPPSVGGMQGSAPDVIKVYIKQIFTLLTKSGSEQTLRRSSLNDHLEGGAGRPERTALRAGPRSAGGRRSWLGGWPKVAR